MNANLKNQAMNASLWRLVQSISVQGTTFAVSVVLARLLLPEDFGLIAVIWIFIAITETFIISGYGKALIQKQMATHVDECSVFYFNIVISVLGCGLLCLLAPWVADFFDQPSLTSLTRVLSLRLVIGAFGHIQLVLLAKKIDFKTRCRIGIAANLVSGIVGITMAFAGFGVWSLIAQQLSRESVRVALAWFWSSWRPAWLFSFSSLRSMFAFGSSILSAAILETVFRNIYAAIIGKLFSVQALGFYSRAYRLQELPAQSLTSVVTGVAFPVFSRVQNDEVRLRNGLRRCLSLLALGVFPVMIGLAIVARPLVRVLLTEKWLPCVPYLQMLCIIGLLYPFYVLHANVLLAMGKSSLFFRLKVFEKVCIVLSIVVTYRWGIMGLVYGQIAVRLLSTFVMCGVVGRLLKYSLFREFMNVLPYLLLSVFVGVLAYGLSFLLGDGGIWLLVTQVLVGAVVYFLCCHMFRLSAFVFVRDFARDRFYSHRIRELVEV